jgi:hypothetical protein
MQRLKLWMSVQTTHPIVQIVDGDKENVGFIPGM